MTIERTAYRLLALLALACAAWLGSCAQSESCGVTRTGNPSNSCDALGDVGGRSLFSALKAQAEACGIDVDCEAPGIELGNASISGVAAVDHYFATVQRFRAEAQNASAALNADVAAIRSAFGIAASEALEPALRAQIAAHVEGELVVRAAPPLCQVDARATLDANARCEGELAPDLEPVTCRGACELNASAPLECGDAAELACTTSSAAEVCAGECVGRCLTKLATPASCAGICNGSCTGACARHADAALSQCAGQCDGECTGSCELALPEGGECDGACTGECTITNPEGGCATPIRARCVPPPSASVLCAGRCDGVAEPTPVRVECQPAVSAQSLLSTTCMPPRVDVDYRLRAGASADASARFALAMELLEARLPALLASLGRVERMVNAGSALVVTRGVTNGIGERVTKALQDGDLRVAFGLSCAAKEAGKVANVVKLDAGRLTASAKEASSVVEAIGLQN